MLLMTVLPTQAVESLRLASGEWPPYSSSTMPNGGDAEQVIRLVFAQAGYEVSFDRLSWKRGYEVARRGKLDGTILWSRSAERERDFAFTVPVVQSDVVFFHRLAAPPRDLAPEQWHAYRLGYPDGYGYEIHPAFARVAQAIGHRLVPIYDDANGLQALLRDRLDAYPVDRRVGLYLLAQIDREQWRSVVGFDSPPIAIEPLCVLISRQRKDSAEVVRRFNASLAELRAQGVLGKWLVELDKPAEP